MKNKEEEVELEEVDDIETCFHGNKHDEFFIWKAITNIGFIMRGIPKKHIRDRFSLEFVPIWRGCVGVT